MKQNNCVQSPSYSYNLKQSFPTVSLETHPRPADDPEHDADSQDEEGQRRQDESLCLPWIEVSKVDQDTNESQPVNDNAEDHGIEMPPGETTSAKLHAYANIVQAHYEYIQIIKMALGKSSHLSNDKQNKLAAAFGALAWEDYAKVTNAFYDMRLPWEPDIDASEHDKKRGPV
ncbi:MAG: hypothetical protein Q9217_005173 [Psora testacea]